MTVQWTFKAWEQYTMNMVLFQLLTTNYYNVSLVPVVKGHYQIISTEKTAKMLEQVSAFIYVPTIQQVKCKYGQWY